MTRCDNEPTSNHQQKQPTWLHERCPGWCVRAHHEHDHPEDRYHQSEGSVLPGVVATRPTIPLTASMERLDMIVWAGRYVGESDAWLVIEPTERREPRLLVTIGTAHGLVKQLSEQLAQHDGP